MRDDAESIDATYFMVYVELFHDVESNENFKSIREVKSFCDIK